MGAEEHARIGKLIEDGYIDKDLRPIKCTQCGESHMTLLVKALDGGHISEEECYCGYCGTSQGYWVQGSWQV